MDAKQQLSAGAQAQGFRDIDSQYDPHYRAPAQSTATDAHPAIAEPRIDLDTTAYATFRHWQTA